jgi:hypothetical protein
MSKAHRKGSKQVSGSSRKNYFNSRRMTMSQGSKGAQRYLASMSRNK